MIGSDYIRPLCDVVSSPCQVIITLGDNHNNLWPTGEK